MLPITGPGSIALVVAAAAAFVILGIILARMELARRIRARTEEARANEALYREAEAARRDAERANRAKSDFLAVMSHEIRTPINAMIGYAELLELGISGPLTEAQRGQLGRIRTSARHLLRQINEVLDVSKVESGRLELRREPSVVVDAVDAALIIVRPLATAKGVVLVDQCEGERDAVFVGDEQRVEQILVNLITNAVKFTAPGGRVRVHCARGARPADTVETIDPRANGTWLGIHVDDTGVGIAPDDLERIFEPFVQVETGLTRTAGGTGLGLTISRDLARLMHGDLTVSSEPGQGSRFTLWLEPADADVASATLEHRRHAPGRRALEATATALADGAEQRPGALRAAGTVLLDRPEQILRDFVVRLRRDDTVHVAADVGDVHVRDHWGAFLADIGETLIVLDAAGEPGQLVLDGTAIQRFIAERHGAQRQRMGWTEEEVRREAEIFRQVMAEHVAPPLATFPAGDREIARVAMDSFVEHGVRASIVGYRQAVQEAS